MAFESINPSLFYGRRFNNLDSALAFVEGASNHNVFDIAYIPPDADINTDEEDGDAEDLIANIMPQDIPGDIEVFCSSDSEDDVPLQELRRRIQHSEPGQKSPKWSKRECSIEMPNTNIFMHNKNEMISHLGGKSELQVFETLFDSEVVEYIVDQTRLYASQCNAHNFSFTENDLKVFLGILLFSGYHSMPRENMYWELAEDTRSPLVSNNMSRNRFKEIKKFVHLADNNNLILTDKMAKVRPLQTLICQKFCQFGYMHEKLSIDESMVKYFGGHSSKQFIRGKPVRFGFKNWMLTSSCGYVYQFDTYCGAKNVSTEKSKLPLGSRVVLDLLDSVPIPTDHVVFFDNFFTSHDLLVLLKQKGFRAIGTTRDSRTKKCPVKSKAEFKKEQRGFYDYRYDTANEIIFVKWNDNSAVTVGSNFEGIEPMKSVNRWCSTAKTKITVQQPKLIADYNSGMGGVDLHDQALNNYRIKFRGKKWWWPLFTAMMSSIVVNAWKLYKEANSSKMDLLEFHRAIVRHYLRNYTQPSISKRSVVPSVALTAGNHFPKRIEKPLRCRQCHNRIRWICELCDVALCVEKECFKNFHIKK